MLLPAIESWRSKLQGSESPANKDDPFTRELLIELNDLSNFLENLSLTDNLKFIQGELGRLLARRKPTGHVPPDRKCKECGRPIP
jgi:hypothetical protein